MKKFNILYVDDEISNLRVFKDTFRREFNIYTAVSAKEGMQIMENTTIDLILSDQRMPGMTGVEFLEYSLKKFPKSARILITGYSDIDAIKSAINRGKVFQYVQKPWEVGTLSKIIKEALRVCQLEQENIQQKGELIIAKEKAEESDRLKTKFIHNMSHEIRTPLNGIVGFSNLLSNPDLSEKVRKGYINLIQNSSNQLLKIIDNILEISKLTTSKARGSIKEVYINEVLEELYTIFNLKANKKNVSLHLNKAYAKNDIILNTDQAKFYSIISCLIDNAIKFTNEGYVEFGYTIDNDCTVFYVRDTGIGVEKGNQGLIFDRFYQENSEINSVYGGLGLGLSIAKENAKLLNAKILVDSEKGKGATFFVKFEQVPRVISEEVPEPATSMEDLKVGPLEFNKILIVEDEKINFLYLETLIMDIVNSNAEILHAEDGLKAIDMCRKNKNIDLVFMDIKMPNMNGYEATSKIREFMRKVPIVAQSAYSTKEDIKKAIMSGCNDFITKPVKKEILRSVMKERSMMA